MAARLGLRVAVVTRLARRDLGSLKELAQVGVYIIVRESAFSTCLRLIYPTDDPDQRTIEVIARAEPFALEDVPSTSSRAYHIGPSIRGEVPAGIVRALKARGAFLSLDAQGYVRVAENGQVRLDRWEECQHTLQWVDLLKVDAAEAELMTGCSDIGIAIARLAEMGPREVLLTHRGGVMAWVEGQVYRAPFRVDQVRGRTGRGDTCTGAYLSKRLLNATAQEATLWAAAVTSLKLEETGPFRRTIDQVRALIREEYSGADSAR